MDPSKSRTQVVIDSAQFRTELTAKAGETLVLGGIIQRQLSDTSLQNPHSRQHPGLEIRLQQTRQIRQTHRTPGLPPSQGGALARASPRPAGGSLNKKMPLIQKWQRGPTRNPNSKMKEDGCVWQGATPFGVRELAPAFTATASRRRTDGSLTPLINLWLLNYGTQKKCLSYANKTAMSLKLLYY